MYLMVAGSKIQKGPPLWFSSGLQSVMCNLFHPITWSFYQTTLTISPLTVLGIIAAMVLVVLFILGELTPILNLFHINESKDIAGNEFPMDLNSKGHWQVLNQS
jgi:hypothetical protein